MEPLAIMWNLSLTDEEGKLSNLVVQDQQVESMIATNFLTRRALTRRLLLGLSNHCGVQTPSWTTKWSSPLKMTDCREGFNGVSRASNLAAMIDFELGHK